MINFPDDLFFRMAATATPPDRPRITVTYAQSLDGSISKARGVHTILSSPSAQAFTHQLRAAHDAILVGRGTLEADNPRLNVRLAPGENPQIIILDPHLRTDPQARIFLGDQHPWLLSGNGASTQSEQILEISGARILRFALDQHDQIDLRSTMEWLGREGIQSVMVEGGARVIESFLRHGLVDHLVITLSPQILAGLNPFTSNGSAAIPFNISLQNPQWQIIESDAIVWGEALWKPS
jgi:riboflavin-specific deaminase-like protein